MGEAKRKRLAASTWTAAEQRHREFIRAVRALVTRVWATRGDADGADPVVLATLRGDSIADALMVISDPDMKWAVSVQSASVLAREFDRIAALDVAAALRSAQTDHVRPFVLCAAAGRVSWTSPSGVVTMAERRAEA